MKYLKEILFLQNLPGIGKATIINEFYKRPMTIYDLLDSFRNNRRKGYDFSDVILENAKAVAMRAYEELSENPDISAITIFDDDYPEKLMDLKGKTPPVLYIMGNIEALLNPSIAVIGTRNPSDYSAKVEENLVKKIIELSDRTIISGLAQGCDYIAHKTCVNLGKTTIAILPCGFKAIPNRQNAELAKEIIRTGGCLISEYFPQDEAKGSTFIERDAIVAALSDATFAVECEENSGTMKTVEYAFRMERHLACFSCDDDKKGKFDGNRYMVNKFDATKIPDTKELRLFLDMLAKEGIHKKMSYEQLWLGEIY